LLPIYGARELPVAGVSSEQIAKNLEPGKVRLVTKDELLTWASEKVWNKEFGEVLVTAGAGDIDTLVPALKQIIENA
jgi:UDP-N-acetylmuramate--alanine ligase